MRVSLFNLKIEINLIQFLNTAKHLFPARLVAMLQALPTLLANHIFLRFRLFHRNQLCRVEVAFDQLVDPDVIFDLIKFYHIAACVDGVPLRLLVLHF